MTHKTIHINFLKQQESLIKSFIEINSKNGINYDKDLKEITIELDIEDEQNQVNKISELIMFILKENKLKEYIWNNYEKLDDKSKEKVYIEAKLLLDQKKSFILKTIYDKISDFIDKDDFINIDGFFKFRMKDFMGYISIISDIALEEYLIKRDKDQFLSTLKYFIDSQDNRVDLLIIHITKEGQFKFYNKYGYEINQRCDKDNNEILSMFIKEDLDYEDFLISVLLTLCPKKIEIIDDLNNKISKEIIENIKIIFENNVKILIKH